MKAWGEWGEGKLIPSSCIPCTLACPIPPFTSPFPHLLTPATQVNISNVLKFEHSCKVQWLWSRSELFAICFKLFRFHHPNCSVTSSLAELLRLFFRNFHCLLGGCIKRGGEGGRGQLPFLFLLITLPFWHLPCRLGFTKRNKIMMEMSWLRGQQICPLYYISMLTVNSEEGRWSSWLFWLWREVTTRNMPAFAG